MHNILITSAGRRVSLVSYFKTEAKKLLGDNAMVYTTDLRPELSSACIVSDKGFAVPKVFSADYIDYLIDICVEHKIGIIIPTIDTELLVLSLNRKRFEKEGIKVLISDSDLISICRDKRKMNDFFLDKGFEIPQIIDRNSPTFPLFIKPFNGSSSQNIFLIENSSMLSEYHVNNSDLMFMEYLSSEDFEEYTIDLYYNSVGELKCLVPRLRIAVRGGEMNKGMTCRNLLIPVIKDRLGVIKGARGCLTLQVFLERKGNRIIGIEINPRFGGGYPLSYLAGANYPSWIIKEYFLDSVIEYFSDWKDKVLLLRCDQEIIVDDFEYK